MTNNADGSSLLQPRQAHLHLHRRSSNSRVHRHGHHHPQIRAPSLTSHPEIDSREEDPTILDAQVTHVVVQTVSVSVVAYIDQTGGIVELQTLAPPNVTPPALKTPVAVTDASLPVSVQASASAQVIGSDPAPNTGDGSADATSTSTSASEEVTSLTSTLSSSSLSSSSTSSSSASAFPTVPPDQNTTSSSLPSSNNTTFIHNLFINSTRTSSSSESTLLTSTDLSAFTISSRTASGQSTASQTADRSTSIASSITANGRPSFTGTAATSATASNTAGPAAAAAADPPTPTSTVVGSVVGSVAGLALIVVAAFFLWRWRKQRANGHMPLDDSAATSRALGAGPGAGGSGGVPPGSGSGGGGGGMASSMADRSLPFMVPSALAALSGKFVPQRSSQNSTAPSGSGDSNTGFYRVSGKKLPSILQHGGDGFTDPRESAMSGDTSFYRDSGGWWGGQGGQRFAVGAPMRPESGIPVFHPGPGKTPVETPVGAQNPFDDAYRLSPPRADAVGRSLTSADGSRGSGSRFTEEI